MKTIRIRHSFHLILLLLATPLLGLAGCGSGSTATPASVRLVNNTKSASLTVALSGNTAFSGQAAGSASIYTNIAGGTYTVTVTSATGFPTAATQTIGFINGQSDELIAYESEGAIRLGLIGQSLTAPPAGFGSLNVVNLGASPAPVDVYVVPVGTTNLSGLTPTFADIANSTLPLTLGVGTFDVIATSAGNRSDVRFTLSSLTVTSTQTQVLALIASSGGSLLDGVILPLAGTAQFAPTQLARVRLVSALPSAGATAVSATVGTATLSPVFAPNPGLYTLVAGNASGYAVTVGGAALATVPPATFASGGDYTVLVYGTPAVPQLTVLNDNNAAPAGGLTNLRLVNGALAAAGGVALYDNGQVLASEVAIGAASPYVGVSSANTNVLQLVQGGGVSSNQSVTLSASSVYSVFVLDGTGTAFVIKDR